MVAEEDLNKIKVLKEKRGIETIIIWETDWKKSKTIVENMVIDII